MTEDPLKVTRNGEPANVRNLWAPCPAFLVGSGSSLECFPLQELGKRGVASLGINNAAAQAPCRAWCFSDPQSKFHHALFLDPSVMTFSPHPKLKRRIKVKTADGFRDTDLRVRDCPNTYGFDRSTCFDPDRFFDTTFAHWGSGKHQPTDVKGSGMLATLLLGMRLLYHLGVRRVHLLGVDHYGTRRRWSKEDESFLRLLPVFERYGFEIWNCNPESKCRVFKFRDFQAAVDDCRGSVPDGPLDVGGWYAKATVKEECEANPKFTPIHFGRLDSDGSQ